MNIYPKTYVCYEMFGIMFVHFVRNLNEFEFGRLYNTWSFQEQASTRESFICSTSFAYFRLNSIFPRTIVQLRIKLDTGLLFLVFPPFKCQIYVKNFQTTSLMTLNMSGRVK